jgi:hypothetical protein
MNMPVRILNFNRNWNNKLNCIIIPTIRAWTEWGELFYLRGVGELFTFKIHGKVWFSARLLSVNRMRLRDIQPELLLFDTGTATLELALKVFKRLGIEPDDQALLLLFKKE